jgi:phosphonate ABC transporter permease subunit PhnE
MEKKKTSPWKSIRTGLAIVLIIVVYAYGVQVTHVSLAELRSEQRVASLVRVLRALAHPDIVAYDQKEVAINAPVYVPCPQDGSQPPISSPDTAGPYLVVTPACGNPGDIVQVEGFKFAAEAKGPLRFVPGSDPANVVTIGRDNMETDASGHFVAQFQLPNRLSADIQYIRATTRQNVGNPHFTQTAYDTWDKIIETIFLALLATTVGTFLAVPLSFIAARNLMKPIRSSLASASLSVLGWPLGIYVGYRVVAWIGGVSAAAAASVPIAVVSIIVVPIVVIFALRWALPEVETQKPGPGLRAARLVTLFAVVLIAFYGLFALAGLMATIGDQFAKILGAFSFLGKFLFQMGDILRIIIPVLGALGTGGALSGFLGGLGLQATERLQPGLVKLLSILTAMAAGATVMALFGGAVEWFYEIGRPLYTLWGLAAFGAAVGLAAALRAKAKDTLAVGMVIYYVTRTTLNALRAIEPLVMAIVFVITVGIGPFAGALALGLHTVVSLAKLYSEQVESIAAGPQEAIQATGASRLQTIIYAVVPQIIPPYISYTMYRWDVNVRMSTIIGFVGGGGIGFLLQQNINLLNYRAASAQILAIAVVVASLDYVSSAIRERFV